MKKSLLYAGLCLSAFCIVGTAAAIQPEMKPVSNEVQRISVKNQLKCNTAVKQLAPGITLSTANGKKQLHSISEPADKTLRLKADRFRTATPPEGYVLYESFEDWDGDDMTWTPEGWTVDMRGDVDRDESWSPAAANPWFAPPADGQYFYGINFSTGNQDEWLISPFVEVAEGMDLTYWLNMTPLFLFKLDNVDWETYSFIGDPEVAATLQIWAQAEDEEWVMLRDYFDEYKEYTFAELMSISPEVMEQNAVSLESYYGKNTRVAFRYVGTDGNTMFIDAIGIGYPAINVSYMSPTDTQYWGFDRTPEMGALTVGIAQYPVFYPITWTNTSVMPNVSYTWSYNDPETAETVTSNETDELTVTYIPDYSSAASMRNNLFYPPTLRGEAAYSTPGEYTAPYAYFQAGGKPEYVFADGSEFEASLLPFNYNELGLGMTTVDDERIGDMSIPVFGYNSNVDLYWLYYSLGDDEDEQPLPGDYSHLLGIANLIMPTTDAPIVVNGITAYGYGLISDDAELKASIYALNSQYNTDYTTFTTIATATISGSEILRQEQNSKGYLCLPFDFDSPAVIQASEEHPAFFVMLEGFHSDKVEYFAPLQSRIPNPDGICYGYILNHIDLSNHISRPAYYSMKSMRYKENGEYINLNSAFAIGLNAEYPWLTTDAETVTLPTDGSAVNVNLYSYYDGSKLTVEAPAGVAASVSGRYDNCKLTLSLEEGAGIVSGNVVVKGPGVSVEIPVDSYTTVTELPVDKADINSIYDLTGNRVQASELTPGMYIVKYNDGSSRKLIIK